MLGNLIPELEGNFLMGFIPKKFAKKVSFIGRQEEISKLDSILNKKEASIIIVYGRRRIGKTFFIEQHLASRNLIKIEGVQGLSEGEQLQQATKQLQSYWDDITLKKIKIENWNDFFEIIHDKIKNQKFTLYLEELQWLASYDAKLISYLKYWWDNYFEKNPNFILVLCGSSPSFMINKVIQSKALHNRSEYVFPFKPFDLKETQEYMGLKLSTLELMDARLLSGGIPQYLKYLKSSNSVFQNICENSFLPGSFFSLEYEKIFTSSLATNPHYKKIIEVISKNRSLDRQSLVKKLKLQSGGTLTDLLNDLQACHFIEKQTPYQLSSKSTLNRYTVSDSYIHFYFQFIQPVQAKIANGDFQKNPNAAMNVSQYRAWLGYAFERWCRNNHSSIAKILQIAGVQYKSGSYFTKNDLDLSAQIDLLFDRQDRVITVCEIKYQEGLINKKVINEFERKLQTLKTKKTIQKVLITASELEPSLERMHYFDKVITLQELLNVS